MGIFSFIFAFLLGTAAGIFLYFRFPAKLNRFIESLIELFRKEPTGDGQADEEELKDVTKSDKEEDSK